VRNFLTKILLLLGLVYAFPALSQLTTNTGQNPQALVENVLLGPGVVVSNIMYNGSPSAIASFSATNTNLGIDQGIVLTTGTVINNGSGPQGPNNQAGCGMDNNTGGSTVLSNLIGGTQTFNAAILEFDFIPFSDTVRFKYVFGSDEYPEFAPPNNSSYNDVFGFFISGPGITGMQNIAQLPTNGSIVSINNVNTITNSQFFNFNGDGNSAPYNNNPFYIQYDGFTDVLEAVSRVQCGETYHLVIAVADVGDGQWDSGIFLEANSLSSETPISVTHTVSQNYFLNPDWMAEGCVSATVTLTREANLQTSLTIPVTIGGTATNGVDYTTIPNTITFNPGQASVSFTLDAVYDNVVEGLETLNLTFQISDPCGNITPFSVNLFIQDVADLQVNINNPSVSCPGENIQLNSTVTGGISPYSYLWSTGETSSDISIAPNASGNYSIIVRDACIGTDVFDTVFVQVPIYTPLVLAPIPDITEVCPFITHTFTANVTGGTGVYTYSWRILNGLNQGSTNSITVNPATTTTYVVTINDNCGASISDTILYTITAPQLLVTVNPPIEICPGDSAMVYATASGGVGNYTYLWTHNGATTTATWVRAYFSGYYEVQVSDGCNTFTVSGFAPITVVRPIADFNILSQTLNEDLPISFQNTSVNAVDYQWLFSDGGSSAEMHANHIFDTAGVYYITLIAEDAKGCKDTITKQIIIKEELYIYIPNTFIPDDDRFNNFFLGSFIGVAWIKLEVFNRWGQSVYYTEDMNFRWDGRYKGKKVQDGTYIWKLIYKPNREIEQLITGHVNVLR
jgi:gliding motility-associated-like protein